MKLNHFEGKFSFSTFPVDEPILVQPSTIFVTIIFLDAFMGWWKLRSMQ